MILLFQQQMQAYVAWTNSQLKKRPGSKVVEDLARDMQDGVALAQLIEIVGMCSIVFLYNTSQTRNTCMQRLLALSKQSPRDSKTLF